MKLKSLVIAAAAMGALCLSSAGNSDEPKGVRVEVGGARKPARQHPLRASKLVGAEVKNSEGTSLGQVDDLVMDTTGQARYFVLTYGGVLGVAKKYCAVPFQAATINRNSDGATVWVELPINSETLEKAPSFTSDAWPDFADERVTKDTDVFFLDLPGVKVRVKR